jgi:hypothetical protein
MLHVELRTVRQKTGDLSSRPLDELDQGSNIGTTETGEE